MTRTMLALLIYASLASAQPWQWEHYQGTFWHQAPDVPWIEVDGQSWQVIYRVTGDFNGNGRDEIFTWHSSSYSKIEVGSNGDLLYWSETEQNLDDWIGFFEELSLLNAVNLDEDVQDELLIYSYNFDYPESLFVRCFDPDSLDPPQFVERPDLIEAIAYPLWPIQSLFGDFNGVNLSSGVFFLSFQAAEQVSTHKLLLLK